MLIRHIATGKVHEVVTGTRFPKQFFEEVTKEKIVSEKKDSTEKPTKPDKTANSTKPSPKRKKSVQKASKRKKAK